jgi:hypothetical protein
MRKVHETNHRAERLARPLALGQVEDELRKASPHLNFHLVGQAHYGESDFAFIEVHGIEDQSIKRQTREKAHERLQELGFPVNLDDSKDVYHIVAIRSD